MPKLCPATTSSDPNSPASQLHTCLCCLCRIRFHSFGPCVHSSCPLGLDTSMLIFRVRPLTPPSQSPLTPPPAQQIASTSTRRVLVSRRMIQWRTGEFWLRCAQAHYVCMEDLIYFHLLMYYIFSSPSAHPCVCLSASCMFDPAPRCCKRIP